MNLRRERIVDGESQFDYSVPSDEEIHFVYRTDKECQFYRYTLAECRNSIARDFQKDPERVRKEGFLKCHDLLQREFQCSTRGLLEDRIEDSAEGRLYFQAFSKCFFEELKPLGVCRKYLDDHPRRLFRMRDSPLQDYKVKYVAKK